VTSRPEPPAAPGPDARPEAEAELDGLRELRDVTPPASFVAAVLGRVTERRRATVWTWLRRPHRIEVRVSPIGALAASAAIAIAVVAGARHRPDGGGGSLAREADARTAGGLAAPATPPSTDQAAGRPGAPAVDRDRQPQTVQVRFVLEARGARRVAVAGDFNDWRTDAVILESIGGTGRFAATVALPRGDHEYMFVVDGRWVTDPAAEARRPDGFGRENALLRL
jgi:hypothetical protein